MPGEQQRLLIVDDETDFARGLARLIASDFPDLAVSTAFSGREALAAMEERPPDLLLLDLHMPDMHGLDVMQQALAGQPELSVIVLSAHGSIETAVTALKGGAWDFLTKPVRGEELHRAIANARQRSLLLGENNRLRALAARSEQNTRLVGDSPAIRLLQESIRAVASSSYIVFIQGESGTGKELAAESIHKLSNRRNQPFIKVNCPAIPESLLESELFGHKKGAFTGAVANRKGLFVEASGGTLMLDEIGDIPLSIQTKLLRVLQDGMVRPVGASQAVAVDTRIIAATNQDMEKKIKSGEFREDLFHRLNVLTIHTPSLREHREDIPLLAARFLAQACEEMGVDAKRLSPEAAAGLCQREWPGNVRELQNFMRRLAVFAGGPAVLPAHLRFGEGRRMAAAPEEKKPSPYKEAKQDVVESFTYHYMKEMLQLTGGNISEAARISGIGRVALQKLLRRIRLDADEFRH